MRSECSTCSGHCYGIEREMDGEAFTFGKVPLLCQRCKAGLVSWLPYEPPKTYGRNRDEVERVYETRHDCRPVPGGARRRAA